VKVWTATLLLAALVPVACSDGGPAPAPTTAPGVTTAPAPAELPVPRTEVAAAVLEGRIVVAGGLTLDGAASDRADIYDPAANRWEPAPALPLGLHHSGMAALGDRVYVAGGYTNRAGQDWVAQSRVLSLGRDDRAWREEPALAAGPRGGLALAAAGGRLVAVGGTDAGGRFLARTEVFTPGSRSWTAGPDMSEPRDHLAAAGSGGRIYAIAGRLGGLDTNKATVESWAPSGPGSGMADPSGPGSGWRAEPRLNDTRGGTSAAEAGGRPCVAGGEEPAGTIASIECLAGGQWSRVATLRTPRHGLGVAGVGDRLHVIAGGPEPGLFVSGAHEAFTVR
jgi:hypothetical protein